MEENKDMIYVPLNLFYRLVAKEEQIAVIERLTEAKGYLQINELRAITAAPPLPDTETGRSFDKMPKDAPCMEEITCT